MDTFNYTNVNIHDGDFMFFIADIFTTAVQYGSRTELCATLMTEDFKKDMVKGIADYSALKKVKLEDYDELTLKNTTFDINKNMRQWTWQYCTEFGWFQQPNTVFPTRSLLLNESYWLDMCQRFYGNISAPNIAYANLYGGGLAMQGENIYFLTANEDPWQYAGMRELYNPVAQSKMKTWNIKCDDCAHCIDLHTPSESDPQDLKDARADVYKTIKEWLVADREAKHFIQ